MAISRAQDDSDLKALGGRRAVGMMAQFSGPGVKARPHT